MKTTTKKTTKKSPTPKPTKTPAPPAPDRWLPATGPLSDRPLCTEGPGKVDGLCGARAAVMHATDHGRAACAKHAKSGSKGTKTTTFSVQASGDPLKDSFQLTCDECGALICDIEVGDDLTTLMIMADDHRPRCHG